MSLALYRKYRPATFAEVKGQEHVTEPLAQALRTDRVHHAYLFSGPRGCGKTSCARILARSLNCVRGPTPDPCGECDTCVALSATGPGHIDVIEIDAASHGGVDDARDLRERAFFAPAAARFKVYIIDEAHMVTREGFNALLKLVEEPPPHLKFVFATTEPEKVIGTIKSRTHHYPFRLVPPGTLRQLVEKILAKEGLRYEAAALPLVVRSAAGSVRDALSVLDQLVAGSDEAGITYAQAVALLGYTDGSLLHDVVDAVAARDGAALFEAVDRVIEGGHDPRRFAMDVLERFRDLAVLSAVPDAAAKGLLDLPVDELERMQGQLARLGPAELSRAAEVFHAGLVEMRGATSPRLLLELMCARLLLPAAAGGDELALLTRLERLERRLAISETTEQPRPAPRDDEPAPPAAASSATGHAPLQPAATQPPPSQGRRTPSLGSRVEGGAEEGESDSVDNATAGASTPQGSLDVTAVRGHWDTILEAVKRRRRVAWMILINDVQVTAIEGQTMTLSFARDGHLKGFMASGCETILAEALREVLGVEWRIACVPAEPGRVTTQAIPSSDRKVAATQSPTAAPAGGSSEPRPGRSPDAGSPKAATGDVHPEHDADAGELSGMALIQRELGGQVISEIDGS